MSKKNLIIYWVSTALLVFGMGSSGIFQLIRHEEVAINFARMGYPEYFPSILGAWKLLGVIVILIPRFPLIKEWAYAGFFFTMSGALLSHLFLNDPLKMTLGSVFYMLMTAISWYFRPDDRRLVKI